MTGTRIQSRRQAEVAFRNLGAEFFAKNKAAEELEAVAQARDAKTSKLRELRLAKQQANRTSATSALLAKRLKPAD